MSFYGHLGGRCIRHRFRDFIDLIKRKTWRQCIDCGKIERFDPHPESAAPDAPTDADIDRGCANATARVEAIKAKRAAPDAGLMHKAALRLSTALHQEELNGNDFSDETDDAWRELTAALSGERTPASDAGLVEKLLRAAIDEELLVQQMTCGASVENERSKLLREAAAALRGREG